MNMNITNHFATLSEPDSKQSFARHRSGPRASDPQTRHAEADNDSRSERRKNTAAVSNDSERDFSLEFFSTDQNPEAANAALGSSIPLKPDAIDPEFLQLPAAMAGFFGPNLAEPTESETPPIVSFPISAAAQGQMWQEAQGLTKNTSDFKVAGNTLLTQSASTSGKNEHAAPLQASVSEITAHSQINSGAAQKEVLPTAQTSLSQDPKNPEKNLRNADTRSSSPPSHPQITAAQVPVQDAVKNDSGRPNSAETAATARVLNAAASIETNPNKEPSDNPKPATGISVDNTQSMNAQTKQPSEKVANSTLANQGTTDQPLLNPRENMMDSDEKRSSPLSSAPQKHESPAQAPSAITAAAQNIPHQQERLNGQPETRRSRSERIKNQTASAAQTTATKLTTAKPTVITSITPQLATNEATQHFSMQQARLSVEEDTEDREMSFSIADTGLDKSPLHAVDLKNPVTLVRNAPDLPRLIAAQLAEVARTNPDRPIELTLNPEELGRLRMTFQADASAMNVVLQVERPETLDLMRRNLELLAQDILDLGYTDVNFTFEDQGGRSKGGQTGNNSAHWSSETNLAPSNLETKDVVQVSLGNATGIDIRV